MRYIWGKETHRVDERGVPLLAAAQTCGGRLLRARGGPDLPQALRCRPLPAPGAEGLALHAAGTLAVSVTHVAREAHGAAAL